MKTVILHVGAGKTGSSAIQSGLARYIDSLGIYGIEYPAPLDAKNASRGKITSGNGVELLKFLCPEKRNPGFDEESFLISFISVLKGSGSKNIIFSNEQLEEGLLSKFEMLKEELDKLNIDLKIIYYLRNFVDHAYSVFGQMVKRSGFQKSFSEYSSLYRAKYKQTIEKLLSVVEKDKLILKVYESDYTFIALIILGVLIIIFKL